MEPADTPELAGASLWEDKLYRHLREHVVQERSLLVEYTEAAKSTQSKAMAYVMGLLLEDERRHHQRFLDIAASLKAMAELSGTEPVIPLMDFDRVDRELLVPLIDGLLAREKQDERELKLLQRELQDLSDSTLWSVVVETMQRDTANHIALLRFAQRHTERR